MSVVDGRTAAVIGSVAEHRPGRADASAARRPDRVSVASQPEATIPVRVWRRRYVVTVLLLDATAALTAAVVAYLLSFGTDGGAERGGAYVLASLALPLVWVTTVSLARAYEPRFLGNGPEEYHRVALAALVLVATVGTVSWAVKAEVARGYVLVVIPVLAVGSVLLRRLARRRLHRRRAHGECVQRTVVVGPAGPVADLVQQLRREPHHGLVVVAACVPDPDRPAVLLDVLSADAAGTAGGLPIAGVDEVLSTVDRCGADVLAVLACPEMGQDRLRRLAWSLEDRDVDLLMAPAVLDVAGPRTTIRPVSGVPLLHVATPELSGSRRVARALLDRVGAAALLVLALPVLLGVAVAVRVTSPGPALFRQRRVGLGGREFTMLKFRTMVRDAEDRLAEVAHLNTHREGVLFKAPDDPRVTRLGAWLRRTSLDELPQLFNVLTGSMSLVGPRPPLPGEARRYEGHVHRRFLVRPGLTGLWQVSGRADLSWEESVRLDLRYVEHWSFALDISILWRTLLVVLRRAGAY